MQHVVLYLPQIGAEEHILRLTAHLDAPAGRAGVAVLLVTRWANTEKITITTATFQSSLRILSRRFTSHTHPVASGLRVVYPPDTEVDAWPLAPHPSRE